MKNLTPNSQNINLNPHPSSTAIVMFGPPLMKILNAALTIDGEKNKYHWHIQEYTW